MGIPTARKGPSYAPFHVENWRQQQPPSKPFGVPCCLGNGLYTPRGMFIECLILYCVYLQKERLELVKNSPRCSLLCFLSLAPLARSTPPCMLLLVAGLSHILSFTLLFLFRLPLLFLTTLFLSNVFLMTL